jgi:voltage-gated potassium channel Kch
MAPLADIIVVVHALIAVFIISGFALIPLGAWFGWRFVRRRWLRVTHLFGILFVALETLFGVVCPLTLWEDWLRRNGPPDAGFIARWVRWALYYDIPLWVFGTIYVVGAAVAILLWRWVPPHSKRVNART